MIRDARPEDAEAICTIYNDAVQNSTAIWNEILVDAENRRAWIAERQAAGFPVLVWDEDGQALGYASFGPFRPHDGYRLTVEHSVYVHPDHRSGGKGAQLMEALIARARAEGFHVMVAAIDAANIGSIRLHARLGFADVGVMRQVGKKFGRWLDLALMQLLLDDRPQP
ncbi:phosphinothricin acetyltransferase [Rhodobacter aestuarii]|uniref:Phosphinothricin acetyltransferase n=1 Tax=Rhodobacter aestuarii TaxID=453582 RepID=A0A1N7N4P8_9RHOB|nr:GNAT family N-acetyltransferase [Rhodobacter aestuarii]PTV96229.1 phosphinothricin acetyltransferase [Rhodobacter aestuarii]SIS93228.1 phosphinothricin acetyltransferase [Rhodobacter aestuarii]